jgi:hypothetical protein
VKEVIQDGKYFDHDQEIAKPEYQDLIDVARLELNYND